MFNTFLGVITPREPLNKKAHGIITLKQRGFKKLPKCRHRIPQELLSIKDAVFPTENVPFFVGNGLTKRTGIPKMAF